MACSASIPRLFTGEGGALLLLVPGICREAPSVLPWPLSTHFLDDKGPVELRCNKLCSPHLPCSIQDRVIAKKVGPVHAVFSSTWIFRSALQWSWCFSVSRGTQVLPSTSKYCSFSPYHYIGHQQMGQVTWIYSCNSSVSYLSIHLNWCDLFCGNHSVQWPAFCCTVSW